jgi:membrane-associated phospholipid phosphatase
MNLCQILIIILFFIESQSFAQNDTTKYVENSEKISPWVFILPSTLISYGAVTRVSPTLRNLDYSIDGKVLKNVHKRYIFDDYIQYAPYAGIYIPDLCGVKAKHNILDRTLVLGTSIIICTGAVQVSKHTIPVSRPDGSNRHSFPSGHTATAFLGAHILFREYKDVSPWIGIAGYGVAVTTGAMRIINRKHWFSDVITGAGIGIISVELSYLLLPVWRKLFKLENNIGFLTIVPLINQNSFGLGIFRIF